jgi:cardiolipin synthase
MTWRRKKPADDFTNINRVRLIRAGSEYFNELLLLIKNSTESLHLQMYIYDDDETGKQVTAALKEAAGRGVSVFVVVDGYASQALSRQFVDDVKASGIHFRFFEPLWKSKSFYFGRRLHHKLVVADTRFALVGGLNISNRYNDMPGQPSWLDFAIHVEGEMAKQLCILAWKTWNGFPSHMNVTPCEKKEIVFDDIPQNEQSRVRMRRNDWVRRKKQISSSYTRMLNEAKKKVTILSSYFLPGRTIRNSLRRAVKHGVNIRIIVSGRSDVLFAKRAERWYYDWLLRNGIELYEYQKNILHGKLATKDDEWMTIGSFNVNDLSEHASIELNLEVEDPAFAKLTREVLEKIMKEDCKRISPEEYKRTKNIFQQFMNWMSYEVFRVGLFIFTFYFKQRD